ncbi:YCF48-related protein [Candidatus Nephthysia bennettiae]|uniref:Photosynthesis system II assembly factor Ycf48/Hcf136-like domain-containing protein n=1 Tax=Candidatus Nephthysia bennettiae TaxID=3127016 RepID=A0A934KBB7_9BACT|nr:hypothetical protein [Candidatus Dormibacteraeota bacterium]
MLVMALAFSQLPPQNVVATSSAHPWGWLNPLPQGNDLNGISCPTVATCLAVGYTGTIMITQNGGGSWQPLTPSKPGWDDRNPSSIDTFFGISCPSVSVCYVVGTNGTILATRNGGKRWSVQDSGTSEILHQISCPMVATCFAVGTHGTIVSTGDGGDHWAIQRSGIDNYLRGISCSSEQFCVAVGDNVDPLPDPPPSTPLLTTQDGGLHWTPQTVPSADFMVGVHCPTTRECLAVGDHGAVLRTVDAGASWTAPPSGIKSFLQSIDCPTASTCFLVGAQLTIHGDVSGDDPYHQVWVTNDALADVPTWSRQSAGDPATSVFSAISCPMTERCNLAGYDGEIWATHDGGARWGAGTSSVTPRDLRDIDCTQFRPVRCVAVGNHGTVLTTSDAGGHWDRERSGTDADLYAVTCPTLSRCLAVGDKGLILVTDNRGVSWERVRSGTSEFLTGVSCPSTTACFAVGVKETILASLDGGATWRPQFGGSPYDPIVLNRVSCVSTSVCLAVGLYGTILWTNDGGTEWAPRTSGTSQMLYGLSCPDALDCFAVGAGGTILKSDNSGRTWAPQSSGRPFAILMAVTCSDATTCVTTGFRGTILTTKDAGATWKPQPSGTWVPIYGAALIEGGPALVVGQGGAILYGEPGHIFD